MGRKQKGSVSVETALVLPIFIYAFLMVWSVTNVIHAQAFIQVGINQAAKELSQYGYILAKAGVIEWDTKNREKAEKFKTSTDDVVDKLVNFTEAIQNGVDGTVSETGTGSGMKEIAGSVVSGLTSNPDNFEAIMTSGSALFSSGKTYFSNPKELLSGLVAVFTSEGSSLVKSRLIAAPIGKALMEKYLKTMTDDPDAYLKHLGVVDGIDGLNFNASTLFDDGTTINLTVIYQAAIRYPFFGEQKMVFKINASTGIWGAGLRAASSSSSSGTSTSGGSDTGTSGDGSTGTTDSGVWALASATRGKQLASAIKNENPTKAVAAGAEYDLYDRGSNQFSSIFSLDPTGSSYSADSGDYNQEAILSKLRYYANRAVSKAESETSVKMQDGNVYEVPKKTEKKYEVILAIPASESGKSGTWDEMAKKVQEETGVTISITYRN